jgi:hypothetical protein
MHLHLFGMFYVIRTRTRTRKTHYVKAHALAHALAHTPGFEIVRVSLIEVGKFLLQLGKVRFGVLPVKVLI